MIVLNRATYQAAHAAFDTTYFQTKGSNFKKCAAGEKARNAVLAAGYSGQVLEGPAEEEGSFSRRSTMRLLGQI